MLVVRDHETGGLRVKPADPGGASDGSRFSVPGSRLGLEAEWRTTGHTSAETPIGAAGRGARFFSGVLDNTDVFGRMARAAGLSRS